MPLASDATGDGFQDYHQVAGRATAVAIDPADPTGNTIYIGGAQGGVWKSTNAATSIANNVTWSAVTDDQATLSIGSIAIQPGNSNPANSVILVGTGEADNSADSYFGLGILRSANGGNYLDLDLHCQQRRLVVQRPRRNAHGLQHRQRQTSTVVAAMAASSEGEDRWRADFQHLSRPLHLDRRRTDLDLQCTLFRRSGRSNIGNLGGLQRSRRIIFRGPPLSRLLLVA